MNTENLEIPENFSQIIKLHNMAIQSVQYRAKDLIESIGMPSKAYKEIATTCNISIGEIEDFKENPMDVSLDELQYKSLFQNLFIDNFTAVADFLFTDNKRKAYFINQCISTFNSIINNKSVIDELNI